MKGEIKISSIKNFHFIGIGGIGMSALALYLKNLDKTVTGSDTGFASYENLIQADIEVYKDYNVERIKPPLDLVVYTLATPVDNVELNKAKELNIPIFSYAEMLGVVSKDKETIAVSGTHGKTTTTAMIAKILIDAGLSPTVIVGSLLNYPFGQSKEKTNFILGKSDYFVVEACEYKRSFLNLYPHILVITNIETDHLDYYKNLSDIQNAFRELAQKVPESGVIISSLDELSLKPVIKDIHSESIDYNRYIESVPKLKSPGEHNRKDAAAAYAVALRLGISENIIKKSLADFAGTWRRFEYRGKTLNGVLVYDDYGHHPTEIKATLAGARELFPDKKIVVVFQPHLYSRTKEHLVEFGESFKDANNIIVAPIFAAREKIDPSISSEMLVGQIRKNKKEAEAISSFKEIITTLLSSTTSNDVIITIGAGDINKVADMLIN